MLRSDIPWDLLRFSGGEPEVVIWRGFEGWKWWHVGGEGGGVYGSGRRGPGNSGSRVRWPRKGERRELRGGCGGVKEVECIVAHGAE